MVQVNCKEVVSKDIPHTTPFLLNLGETFDVGIDTRTAVDPKDYTLPFRFSGIINKVTIKIGKEQLAQSDLSLKHNILASINY